MTVNATCWDKMKYYVFANMHILMSLFWYKNKGDHNLIILVSNTGNVVEIGCACGKRFWESTHG